MSVTSVITVILVALMAIRNLLNVVDKHLEKKKYRDAWKYTFGDMTVKEVLEKLEELKEKDHDWTN